MLNYFVVLVVRGGCGPATFQMTISANVLGCEDGLSLQRAMAPPFCLALFRIQLYVASTAACTIGCIGIICQCSQGNMDTQ